jgi:4-diphosphocytidyl-2-C-methyl-D-erythritol kinase
MHEVAYAKINLALHVRERRADGYHRIETLFAFAEDGDRLSVSESDDLRLDVVGPFAAALEGENLVLRAAAALRSTFEVRRGAALVLDKQLPVASGIGGGSADAAAAMRLLVRWWALRASERDLLEIAAKLGADVPACLRSDAVRGTGRGDDLEPVEMGELIGMPLLLVNPLVPVPTGPVFARWDRIDRGALGNGAPIEAALAGRNDLQAPATAIAPAIAEVLQALEGASGVRLARMSGSGATCFALLEDEQARHVLEARIASEHPDWWRLSTRLR